MTRTTKPAKPKPTAAPTAEAAPALKIARVPLASLVHDPDNPRTHDERNLAGIKASLEQFG